MTRMVEVIYEDEVLKPLAPIEGLRKSERMWILLCPRPDKAVLHELVGTLTHEEAREMQKLIDEEFGGVEGERRSVKLNGFK